MVYGVDSKRNSHERLKRGRLFNCLINVEELISPLGTRTIETTFRRTRGVIAIGDGYANL